jgi:glutathione S-transferase
MITLYSAPTPNGYKASCTLEELGLPYSLEYVDIYNQEQKEEWFMKISPNNTIPAMVIDGLKIFDSAAIMQHLAERCGRLMPKELFARVEMLKWFAFQSTEISPVFARLALLNRYQRKGNRQEIERLKDECYRLLGILDDQLKDKQYIAFEYSISDIATWSWVRIYEWMDLKVAKYKHVNAWLKLVGARPAIQRGIENPTIRGNLIEHVRDVQRLLAQS